ncbi:MAG TPA: tetratricopeptide repeat protein, partial [Anaerolineae bacterium]|nr:tetratricopeptide repeat protein [Anaerolineae bacterium]
AGKEDQLRAQAEQEAETRMAAIMGRKPGEVKAPEAAVEEKSTTEMAAVGSAGVATVVAAQKEEPPAEVPEEMPSADDALAFLTRLAAGKEDQLRAQAEQEAETRMAAIMGRSAPLESAKPIEKAPAAGPIELPETLEAAEPVAEAELPEWLRGMRPTEEAVEETPEGELPEWLRAMRPSEESPAASLTGLLEEEVTPAPEAAMVFDEVEEETTTQDLVAELAALEQAAAQPEAAEVGEAPAKPQTAALLPIDWWMQTAGDTEEESLTELPQPYLSPRARAAEKEKAAAAAAVVTEEKPLPRKLPQTGPLRQTGPLGVKPQTAPLATPEQAAVSTEVEALLAHIYQNPEDHAARLDLARTYWAIGNREGAYTEYLTLVTAGEFTKETMADLETIVEIHDQTDWHRMLGDVYMKAGRLASALEQYRRALSEV